MTELTSPQKAELFKLLDDYSKLNHRCFVAEMDWNKDKKQYSVCFRPVGGQLGSAMQYACRYAKIHIADANKAANAGSVHQSLAEFLDKELAKLHS